jgi:murein DD-endopeptidase MepM/ murein hydrolase activator NlpD
MRAAALALLLAASPAAALELRGALTQGGMAIGQVAPGAEVALDGRPIRVSPEGLFVIGFGRDHKPAARLTVNGEAHELAIAPRSWDVQRIDGLPPATVTPDEAQLARIRAEAARVREARSADSPLSGFAQGFIWPTEGRISGVFGSQRILNGEPRQPHYGVDVAAPTGTPVRAPAAGRVTLAEPDLFLTGGTILLDHGHGLFSVFAHLSRLDVRAGEEVPQGALLGAVGGTGRVTAPHLHWGLSWFDERLDPALLVPPMPEGAGASASPMVK